MRDDEETAHHIFRISHDVNEFRLCVTSGYHRRQEMGIEYSESISAGFVLEGSGYFSVRTKICRLHRTAHSKIYDPIHVYLSLRANNILHPSCPGFLDALSNVYSLHTVVIQISTIVQCFLRCNR